MFSILPSPYPGDMENQVIMENENLTFRELKHSNFWFSWSCQIKFYHKNVKM